ncbi:hypothetical protein V8C86DRAFT_994651 [Haematococcus lacustris]
MRPNSCARIASLLLLLAVAKAASAQQSTQQTCVATHSQQLAAMGSCYAPNVSRLIISRNFAACLDQLEPDSHSTTIIASNELYLPLASVLRQGQDQCPWRSLLFTLPCSQLLPEMEWALATNLTEAPAAWLLPMWGSDAAQAGAGSVNLATLRLPSPPLSSSRRASLLTTAGNSPVQRSLLTSSQNITVSSTTRPFPPPTPSPPSSPSPPSPLLDCPVDLNTATAWQAASPPDPDATAATASPSAASSSLWSTIPAHFQRLAAAGLPGWRHVPLDGWTLLLHYRRDVLAAAGLAVPQTWPQLLHVATRLNGSDMNGDGSPDWGICLERDPDCGYSLSLGAVLSPLLQAQGTSQGSLLQPEDLTPLLGSQAMVTALTLWAQLAALAPSGSVTPPPDQDSPGQGSAPTPSSSSSGSTGESSSSSGRAHPGACPEAGSTLFQQGRCAFVVAGGYVWKDVQLGEDGGHGSTGGGGRAAGSGSAGGAGSAGAAWFARGRTGVAPLPGWALVLNRTSGSLQPCTSPDMCPYGLGGRPEALLLPGNASSQLTAQHSLLTTFPNPTAPLPSPPSNSSGNGGNSSSSSSNGLSSSQGSNSSSRANLGSSGVGGSAGLWVNRAPFSPSSGAVGVVSRLADKQQAGSAVLLLLHLATQAAHRQLALSAQALTILPMHLPMLDPGALPDYVAAGFHANDTASYLAATLDTLSHPNIVMSPCIPGTLDIMSLLSWAAIATAQGGDPITLATEAQAQVLSQVLMLPHTASDYLQAVAAAEAYSPISSHPPPDPSRKLLLATAAASGRGPGSNGWEPSPLAGCCSGCGSAASTVAALPRQHLP